MNRVSFRPPAARPSEWVCSGCRAKQLQKSLHGASGSSNGNFSPNQRMWRRRKADINSRRSFATTRSLRAAPMRNGKLPEGPARTRFAPSPTGYLHIGGLRTALFSYLLAKRTQGQFLLRIEDTDQKRLVSDAEQRLCEDLQWAGLQWDEGPHVGGPYGPYRQSERNDIYQKHARTLLDKETAYRCFCTQQHAGEAKAAYVTSGCFQACHALSCEESQDRAESNKELFTIRLHTPADAHKRVYPDLIYGKIPRLKRSVGLASTSEDDNAIGASDTILVKSDGTPTYHFANVVDDHLMKITHVIRGSEWMASTPLHYDIYSAFNWSPPKFAHVGLLVDENKAKLSKRNADLALDVQSMRTHHTVLAEPLINFLALLGWSNPTRNDVMDLQGLVNNFDLKFTRGNAMVRMEKLWFLQQKHVARKCEEAQALKSFGPIQEIVRQLTDEVTIRFPQVPMVSDHVSGSANQKQALETYCACILLADSKDYKNAHQWVKRNRYFFQHGSLQDYKPPASLTTDDLDRILEHILSKNLVRDEKSLDGLCHDNPDYGGPTARPFVRLEVAYREALHSALDAAKQLYSEDELSALLDKPKKELENHDQQPSAGGQASTPFEGSGRENGDSVPTSAQIVHDQANIDAHRNKVLQSAIMKYLRAKVSYGFPGPSMGAVMAVLGLHECCRRLGIDVPAWSVEKQPAQGESVPIDWNVCTRAEVLRWCVEKSEDFEEKSEDLDEKVWSS